LLLSHLTVGDFTCQVLEAQGEDGHFSFDWKRTLRIGAVGVFVLTPLSIGWNNMAERIFPGRHVKAMAGKLGIQVSSE
jgi:hypothetical protein